jgi:hypothetical protein
MKIQITEDDIARGTPQSCYYCPVANVLSKLTHSRYCVVVTPNFAHFYVVAHFYVDKNKIHFPKEKKMLVLPPEVTDFILKVDDYQEVAPIEFELPIETLPTHL